VTTQTIPSSKYADVRTALIRQLRRGQWKPGDRIPTEAQLVQQFGVSRITVARAVRELESEGLVERRRGAGTFVRSPEASGQLSFGLLIPELGETEIFEPICQGLSRARMGTHHELLWGPTLQPGEPKEVEAEHLCESYLKRGVSGIFFAPLELTEGKDEVNLRITRSFDEVRIPVVLLDRDIY